MWGINGSEALIIALIAFLLIGPDRLPHIIQQLKNGVGKLKGFVNDTKVNLSEEYGDEIDWEKLDPRQYDPRRIVQEAFSDDDSVGTSAKPSPRSSVPEARHSGGEAPFDSEAT